MELPEAAPFVDTLRPWEVEESFADSLNAWMNRSPWVALSFGAHLLAFFVLMSIPWEVFHEKTTTVVLTVAPTTPEETLIEELEPKVLETLPEEPIEEPVLHPQQEPQVDQDYDTPSEADSDRPSDVLADNPFDDSEFADIIGIGGGAGSKYAGRFGQRGGGHGDGGTAPALEAGLDWLARHQDKDGKWDADGFAKHDPAGDTSTGPGQATQDVGVTGLALLAFLGDGSTTNEGPYRDHVARGIRWLRDSQDPDTGRLGTAACHEHIYGHAIATLALSEAYFFTKSPLIGRSAQAAVNYIARARNPYGAWRYDVPSAGDSDTSVTGWMVLAMTSAKDAGLLVDEGASAGALSWLDQMSDPATGRCGYDSFGSLSSRTPSNDHYPRENGEAMTAVALFSRFLLGQDPDSSPIMKQHADLLARTLPEWDPEGLGCDMYAWYYGTYAMYQMGGRYWKSWNKAMKVAVLDSQRRDGAARGSWDPVGPWGYSGGRVYSTALMTLMLEVYFRYARCIGTR